MAGMEEESTSPKNRLKFLCSYGGRILPRPSDGQLKYVGGETRVLAVPRSVTFPELKERITGMFNAEVVVKYQVMPEDLDALVSVRTDEDLHHMLHEYDRHDQPRSPTSAGSPRFRLFLFPSSSAATLLHHHDGPSQIEQRYVDTINAGVPIPTAATTSRPIFTLSSSAGTSPTSTIDSAIMTNNEALPLGGGRPGALARHREGGGGMHRVRSTPNLSGSQSPLAGTSVGSPHFHRHPQQKYPTAYGVHPASGGGCFGGAPWKTGGGAARYEVCGCGCGCPIVGQHLQPVRRYYYSPSAGTAVTGPTAGSGGCVCSGHVDDAGAPRSGQGVHFAAAPPRKPTCE